MPTADGTTPPAAHPVRTATAEQRWAAGSAIVGGALATLLTCGVLTGAVLASYNALGDVGRAAHIPDLPVYALHALAVALDGLAGVALLTLIVLQPGVELRRYCWLLVSGCIAISMLANGAHAIFDDPRGRLVLPVWVAFLISTVPALSAAAALHLILLIAHEVVGRVRTLLAGQSVPAPAHVEQALAQEVRSEPAEAAQPGPASPAAAPAQPRATRAPDAAHPAVLDALSAGRGYRTVMLRARWPRPRAEAALRAARKAAQAAQDEEPPRTFRPEPAMSGQGAAA